MIAKISLLAAVALAGIAAPASAQSYDAQRRWDDAQERYRAETARYEDERERFYASRRGDRGSWRRDSRDDDRFVTQYDAARDYRESPRYSERVLTAEDQVYRGSDGRNYCRRSDGTTGLIVGAAAGGLFGNVLDGGRRRTAGTLFGGALGALLGRSIEQNQDQLRCR